MKSVLKKQPTKLVNIKVNPDELAILIKQAKKYASGNLSLWLRFAGMNHTPKPKDLK